tara:strand:- start:12071 stop:12424 length:354 start_codon:yes stop_codon:yes gene_type:complete
MKINGKEYKTSYGIQALMELVEHYDGFSGLGQSMIKQNFSVYVDMVFFAIKAGAEWTGKTLDLSRPEVYEWCYANRDNNEFLDVIKVFSESINKHVSELTSDLEAATTESEGDLKKK